ncbi:4Fe-4S dicluster domain-containing protein [Thermosinus carboxydivorans]|nr:4Fe-4S dicluster domain-containing protein [Thermosinus carboxydivorans]
MATAFWEKTVWAAEKVLRPPGALPEPEFTAVCNRCGRCIKVRCDLCLACQEVCPTGAIAKVPLEKVRMGRAVIDQHRCIAWNEGKACLICGEQCPVLAIAADEQHRPSVLVDKCVGCGSCENACPVDGEAAIRVFPG